MAANVDLIALLADLKKSMEAGREKRQASRDKMKNRMEQGPTSLTFYGLTSWIVFKTQLDVVSFVNRWTDFVKANQLVTSGRGSAAEVLQGISANKLMDLTTIE
ncbi:hypothetical protein AVEN_234433-1 [Araneus ventricosus]|uniref:Uncharacterized protein n=1 Tax=Araneus ventricosus TaxID=182803 RepID=A0A4Y2A9W4_ARAVE|nr:hypothetical protein AVEN_234433-1 [Araneus ventricosus]